MNLDSGSQDAAERDLALLTYVRTHSATIGKSVVMPSDYAVHKGDALSYSYVVAHCAEVGEETLVRMECCRDESSESCACMAKRIVFEFHGGYLHGRRLDNRSANVNEALLALAYYCVTEQGAIGKRIGGMPVMRLLSKANANHFASRSVYSVTSRLEDDEQVLVRVEYQSKGENTEQDVA
jgi:hypothetical protein